MLVENDGNLIIAKMFLMYKIIAEKNLIKQKKILCFMKGKEVLNFLN